MSPFLFVAGPLFAGFALAVLMTLIQYRVFAQSYRSVKAELSAVIEGDISKLASMSDEVIKVFSKHGYALSERASDELVFKHQGWKKVEAWTWVYWVLFFATGGLFGLGLVFSVYVLGWFGVISNQVVTLKLTY